jgi:hypothetical protein
MHPRDSQWKQGVHRDDPPYSGHDRDELGIGLGTEHPCRPESALAYPGRNIYGSRARVPRCGGDSSGGRYLLRDHQPVRLRRVHLSPRWATDAREDQGAPSQLVRERDPTRSRAATIASGGSAPYVSLRWARGEREGGQQGGPHAVIVVPAFSQGALPLSYGHSGRPGRRASRCETRGCRATGQGRLADNPQDDGGRAQALSP